MAIAATSVLWATCWLVFDALYNHAAHLGWDTSIVAASVMTQCLMTWKKQESWLPPRDGGTPSPFH